MLELGRREHHLLSGLGVQVLVVVFLVFAYTQAARQIKSQKEMYLKLREQFQEAKLQVAREADKSNVQALQTEISQLYAQLLPPERLSELKEAIISLAKNGFSFSNVEVKECPIEKTIEISIPGGAPLTVELRALEFSGTETTRGAAQLSAAALKSFSGLLCPLEEMELKGTKEERSPPVFVRLKWRVATSPQRGRGTLPAKESVRKEPMMAWGLREEPFLSPFQHPSGALALVQPQGKFRLTGILWGEGAPSCVINDQILRVGDKLADYEVVLITPNAVLLSAAEEEVFLPLPQLR